MPTVHADVPGRGKGSGESRIRVRDQGIPDNKGIGCGPKQIKGLDCLGPWGMGLRTRPCRNPLKVKNAILEAPGNSRNNPGTRWNLAVQRRNCPVVNSTILEGCEISRGIFRPPCEINPVRNFRAKNSLCEPPPPPVLFQPLWQPSKSNPVALDRCAVLNTVSFPKIHLHLCLAHHDQALSLTQKAVPLAREPVFLTLICGTVCGIVCWCAFAGDVPPASTRCNHAEPGPTESRTVCSCFLLSSGCDSSR